MIPRLDIKGPNLVKGIHLINIRRTRAAACGQHNGEQQSPVREAVTLGAAASDASGNIHALFPILFTAWID